MSSDERRTFRRGGLGVLLSVLIAAAVAFFLPGAVLGWQPLLAPAFALTMILVGTLVRSEHRRSFRRAPLRPLTGLMCQYTVMPLTALADFIGLRRCRASNRYCLGGLYAGSHRFQRHDPAF